MTAVTTSTAVVAASVSCELCALLAAPTPASVIFRDAFLTVVEVDDPAYPGFCRVLCNAHVKEMSDLAPEERATLMAAVWTVEQALRDVMAPDKINLASLGNMTPHLHWHVIPRYTDDATFPQPVWASALRTTDAATHCARRAMLPRLRASIAKQLGSESN